MILALDLGTKTGWALHDGTNIVGAGVWQLQPNRYDGSGMRTLRLKKNIEVTLAGCLFSRCRVVYEEVRRHMGVDAAHWYGGYMYAMLEWCEQHVGGRCEAIPVGTIKKHATGKGNAGKLAMIEAARKRWPHVTIIDDNQADAMWLADLAVSKESKP